MFTWNKNHRACTTTWTTLIILDQIDTPFVDSPTVKIQDFTFWNQAGSSDMRKLMANTLAIQMDNIFTMTRGAQYNSNSMKEAVINGMVNILTVGNKTISDLAEFNDSNYTFWTGENTHEN